MSHADSVLEVLHARLAAYRAAGRHEEALKVQNQILEIEAR